MSVEVATLWGFIKVVGSIVGGAIISFMFWITKTNHTKLQNTYTKAETDELVDLKIKPIEQKVDSNAKVLEDKFDLLLDLVKTDNEQIRADNERHAAQRKENTKMLQTISTDVAVIRNDVDNLKEKVNKDN